MTVLTDKAQEKGTYIINLAYYDEDSNAVTPNSVSWTLTEATANGQIINGREAVAISVPATNNDVVLSSADLSIPRRDVLGRLMTVAYAYNSAAGSGLPGRAEIYFEIESLQNV